MAACWLLPRAATALRTSWKRLPAVLSTAGLSTQRVAALATPRLALIPPACRRGGLPLHWGAGGARLLSGKFRWPDDIEERFNDEGLIGDPDDPPLDRDIEIKSDEEMRAEAQANIRKAEEYLLEHATKDMGEAELQDLVRKAMELHIPPPPSWQEMVMVEEEKKRMGKMGDRVKAKADLDRAKEMAMKRIPIIDKFGRAYATGKRKTARARVWVTRGTGNIIINRKMMIDYFMRLAYREEIYSPLRLTGAPLKWDVWATVKGGGRTGQALAIRHGVAQALQAFDIETYRPLLKRFKFLTFDSRQVERKKPGQRKARKKFQWVKR